MVSPDLVARAVAQIRKSAANAEYFFENLSSPEWLEPLKSAGFFSEPPPPVPEGEYISFPGWPESRYLARMAALESAAKTVFSIASKIPLTKNVRVFHDLAEIALALPPDLGAQFVPAAKAWINSPYQLLIPEQLGKLVQRLANGGKVGAALDLAKSLLELQPESQVGTGTNAGGSRDVRAHFDEWHYEKILREYVPALVEAGGERALSMLCDLLNAALELSNPNQDAGHKEDHSWIWRPAIEDHTQNSGQSVKDALVAGVRDAAEQVVRHDLTVLARLVAELEARGWTVFRRIALHLAATFAVPSTEVAEARLTDRALFEDISVRHEFYNLARAAFANIPASSQGTVLSYIEQGPDMEAAERWLKDALRRKPTSEELVRFKRTWQLERLSPLRDALSPPWSDRYQQWTTEFGAPEHPSFAAYHSSGWVGASSPKSADELRSLGIEALVRFLSTWEPSGRWGGPSREGLANELKVLVASDPAVYALGAMQFESARPIFLRALVSGLQTATGQGRQFAWASVLELLALIVQREVGTRSKPDGFPEEDPDLGWTRKAIADFISGALAHEERSPPDSMRTEVWKVLSPLAEDPDPTTEDEERYGPPNMDPFTMSLNTTRGQALHGVVNYAEWQYRHSAAEHGHDRRWLTQCVEARQVLEQHLEPAHDPSSAVRAVYGQRLPTLAYLDIEWVRAHLGAIFPGETEHRKLRDAAWDALVVFCAPQTALLPLLRDEYAHAVGSLESRSERKHGRDPVERLAEHLMTLYWWGDVDLAVDSLVSRFFSLATDDLREHAMDFIGLSLCGPETPPSEVLRRLQLLWEARFDVAKARPESHIEELSGFGWWFASGRFDYEWALRQLRAVVQLTRKIEPAHKVIERLADCVNMQPLGSLLAFEEIVEADKQGWLVSLAREDAERLLRAALARDESRASAVDVLHRLGAKGHSEFRNLLRPP